MLTPSRLARTRRWSFGRFRLMRFIYRNLKLYHGRGRSVSMPLELYSVSPLILGLQTRNGIQNTQTLLPPPFFERIVEVD